MERLTTDTPQTNMEILANYAYAKDKEVRLIYGDGNEDVALADYIADHAKEDFGCTVRREDVLNGDSCWECDCPLAALNAVATLQTEKVRGRGGAGAADPSAVPDARHDLSDRDQAGARVFGQAVPVHQDVGADVVQSGNGAAELRQDCIPRP